MDRLTPITKLQAREKGANKENTWLTGGHVPYSATVARLHCSLSATTMLKTFWRLCSTHISTTRNNAMQPLHACAAHTIHLMMANGEKSPGTVTILHSQTRCVGTMCCLPYLVARGLMLRRLHDTWDGAFLRYSLLAEVTELGGSTFLRNVGICLPNHMTTTAPQCQRNCLSEQVWPSSQPRRTGSLSASVAVRCSPYEWPRPALRFQCSNATRRLPSNTRSCIQASGS
jgi:hypothetical protein